MRGAIFAALLPSLVLLAPAFAQNTSQTAPQMKWAVNASPPIGTGRVLLTLEDGSEPTLQSPVLGVYSVPADAAWMRATLGVVWEDDKSASYPIRISSTLADSPAPFPLYLWKAGPEVPATEAAALACVNRIPASTPRDLLLFIRDCGRLTQTIEAASGDRRYTRDHKQALWGWIRASYNLYAMRHPAGAYGVDPEVIARANEIINRVDNEGYSERSFLPIILKDVRELVNLHKEEDIRLAPLVQRLTEQRRWDEAKRLNDHILARFDALSQERSAPVIRGINRELLLKNDQFIEQNRKR